MSLLLALSLLVPLLAACDGDDDAGVGSGEPVKIGLLTDWSGAMAVMGVMADETISLVEDQVNAGKGIMDGRPLKIETADAKGNIDEAVVAFRKLALEDKVSVVVGGSSSFEGVIPDAPTTRETGVPFFSFALEPDDLTDHPYTVRINTLTARTNARTAADFILNELKAKKVAFLSDDDEKVHKSMQELKWILAPQGIQIVYEQYPETGTVDFSRYLTEIKEIRPDVVISWHSNPSAYQNIFGTISGMDDWKGISYLSLSPLSVFMKMPAGVGGIYHLCQWVPGLSNPANKVFMKAFRDKFGRDPNIAHFYYYTGLWGAIHAIELAGSDDPQDVVEAARSGQLEWESPAGLCKISKDGEHSMTGLIAEVRDGEIVMFEGGE